jgi:hypothetical protein
MEVAGFTPIVESQPALVARIAQEQDKWKKVIERIKCDDSKKNLSIHSLHRELLLPPAANVTER